MSSNAFAVCVGGCGLDSDAKSGMRVRQFLQASSVFLAYTWKRNSNTKSFLAKLSITDPWARPLACRALSAGMVLDSAISSMWGDLLSECPCLDPTHQTCPAGQSSSRSGGALFQPLCSGWGRALKLPTSPLQASLKDFMRGLAKQGTAHVTHSHI